MHLRQIKTDERGLNSRYENVTNDHLARSDKKCFSEIVDRERLKMIKIVKQKKDNQVTGPHFCKRKKNH